MSATLTGIELTHREVEEAVGRPSVIGRKRCRRRETLEAFRDVGSRTLSGGGCVHDQGSTATGCYGAHDESTRKQGSMPPKSTKLHDSGPGADENWCASPEGRRQTRREFERALKDGTLIHSSGSRTPRTDPNVLRTLLERAKA
jgi:hypothetical protein